MIAVSDAVLLVVSAALLATGLYRWQNNLDEARQPSPTSQSSSALSGSNSSGTANNANGQSSANTSSTTEQTTSSTGANSAPNTQSTDTQTNQTAGSASRESGSDTTRIVDVQPVETTSVNINGSGTATLDTTTASDPTSFSTYTVVPGDSLSQIAERFGTSVIVLQELNGIDGSLIRVGQQIRFPL